MRFLNRIDELHRLDALTKSSKAGFVVVYGRRRIGKTRLLVEWSRATDGIYSVADQSTSTIQRRYLAESIAARLPGFADVTYPDWRSLFARVADAARSARYRGPIVLDEFPYLVTSAPELPSALQAFLDGPAKEARLIVAIAGSSQRMMQGLVLDASAPLYGRATTILEIRPLAPNHLAEAFPRTTAERRVELFAALGGVPRYWELAQDLVVSRGRRNVRILEILDRLVMDPLGPLHREPDRLLAEEVPSAAELRPVLDAIGSGSRRVSEIGARLGRNATSLARPLSRLVEMGIVRREIPFSASERDSKRSLYRIADPFFRLWFRAVAPYRGRLAVSSPTQRIAILEPHFQGLVAMAFEELSRGSWRRTNVVSRVGDFDAGSRWWRGSDPEWDLVARAPDGRCVVGEAKWMASTITDAELRSLAGQLRARPMPEPLASIDESRVTRVLFVPRIRGTTRGGRSIEGVRILTASDLLD